MMRLASSVALSLLLGSVTAAAQPLVFVVRHAERADSGGAQPGMMKDDPDLSSAGRARAASLAALLKDARVTAIFTSEYKRARQTAAPLAKMLGIQPTVIRADDGAGLSEKLKAITGNALVVGHSNTVPEVIERLGVSEKVALGESDFDNLFVVIRGSGPALLRLHYR